jgi:hypothetical protein
MLINNLRISKKLIYSAITTGLLLQLSACATRSLPFRNLGPEETACRIYSQNAPAYTIQSAIEKDLILNKKNPIKDKSTLMESEILGDSARCYEQRHELKLKDGSGDIKFQLNFLEFNENGNLRDKEQWNNIKKSLNEYSSPKYVIVFVHGWRHDARVDDTNVRAFRTELAFASRYLHERQSKFGKNAQVFGIYIGWPANVWRWQWIDNLQIPTGFTFWSRKNESEEISGNVATYIKSINDMLNEDNQENRLNRMLIEGHSFGGNLLITGLKGDFKQKINESTQNTPIRGIGDLVVLLNPASDFENWRQLQEEDFRKSGYQLPSDNNASFIHSESKYYSSLQKPILVSLTSTCDWSIVNSIYPPPKDKNNENDDRFKCDWATGMLFPIAQFLIHGKNFNVDKAIGHVRPYIGNRNTDTPNQDFGTTHELELNQSSFLSTQYINAAYSAPLCPIADGWLSKVEEERVLSDDNGRNWDTWPDNHSKKHPSQLPSAIGSEIQLRHGSFRQKFRAASWENSAKNGGRDGCDKSPNICKNKVYSSLGPAHDPFWNIASHNSAIPDHNTIFAHPVFCTLNQIVLDDIVKSDGTLLHQNK